MGLDILHGIPFVDRRLVRVDMALIVTDPGEEEAAWVVVVDPSHFAGFVKALQGGPGDRGDDAVTPIACKVRRGRDYKAEYSLCTQDVSGCRLSH